MQTLERRLTALEQASPTTNTEPVFIHIVGLGNEDAEIQRITQGGKEWKRQPGDTESILKDRATGEAMPPRAGCRTVFLCY
jgi:hypothetical protein